MMIELRPAFKDPEYRVYDGRVRVGEIRFDRATQTLRFDARDLVLQRAASGHTDTIQLEHAGVAESVTVITDTYRDGLVSVIGGQELSVRPKGQYLSLSYNIFLGAALIGVVKHAGFPGLKFKVQISLPVAEEVVWASACFVAWSLFTGRHPDLRWT